MIENVKRYKIRDALADGETLSVSGFVVLASDYDSLAQRCRELEAERNHFAIMHQRSKGERDALRAEVERLRVLIDQIQQIVTHRHESKEALASRVRQILEV